MVTWEGRTYTITLSTAGGGVLTPPSYKFHFEPTPPNTTTAFYKIVGDSAGNNPFKGCVLIPQNGRQLTKFIPTDDRLDETQEATYPAALQALVDEIVGDKINEDPFAYERLVGFIPNGNQHPINPVTFYKVEHTHKTDSKVLLVVVANMVGGAPSGSIVIIS